jgi:poly(glycerol-phosphate) alpha-glucosyltransferase
MSMRITFLNRSLSREDGGVFEAARRLAQELVRTGEASVEALGLLDRSSAEDEGAWSPVSARSFPREVVKSYGYTRGFRPALDTFSPDVCHVHGLWLYSTLVARQWAQQQGRPLLISPHGMLDRWALANARWKKQLVGWLVEDRNLREANCLHATCEAELHAIRDYGLRNPVAVIPNAVDLPDRSADPGPPPWRGKIAEVKKVLLYFGRLHPKKGLRPLIEGWAELQKREPARAEEWTLVIAGWDRAGYAEELQSFVKELSLGSSIHFAGPHYGKARDAVYRHANAFILPSFSEGLPLAVLEAWAEALPVLMTDECNLPQGFAASAAVRVKSAADDLAENLLRLMQMTDEERRTMGENGLRLVESHFSWTQAAAQMLATYRWMLGKGDAPACVSR